MKCFTLCTFSNRAAATGAAYQATAQTGYAVAPAATATYGTQRTAGYDQAAAYQAATPGTYASKFNDIYNSLFHRVII